MKKLRKFASVLMLAAAVVFAAGCTKPNEPNNEGNDNNGGDTPEVPTIPQGAVDGKFSINDHGGKVYFSRGNLQWSATNGGTIATTHAVADGGTAEGTWRFGNPWDFVGGTRGISGYHPEGELWEGTIAGSNNCLASSTYTGWMDLFSWGTSGWSGGVMAYHPYDMTHVWEYLIVGDDASIGFEGQYANADWGVYNAISNGGNQPGLWRTLTGDEWEYVINGREGSRYCAAIVNGVKGVILIPDGWDNTVYTLNSINSWVGESSNTIDQSTWESTCEPAGLVFLPHTGRRICSVWGNSDNYTIVVSLDMSEGAGRYWASSVWVASYNGGTQPYSLGFHIGESGMSGVGPTQNRSQGFAVRLVQDVE